MRTTMTSCGKALSERARPTMAVLVTTMAIVVLVLFGSPQHSASAATSPGNAWSWGSNWEGQLGLGSDATVVTGPAHTRGLTGVVDVAGGGSHTTWLNGDGTVWASGSNNFGALGDGTRTHRYRPVQVSGLTNVVDVDNGGRHSLAVKGDGTVWAWGDNYQGRLGDGTFTDRLTPVQVSGLTGVTDVEAGENHSIALKANGTVWAWGDNYNGQLGNNQYHELWEHGYWSEYSAEPVQVVQKNDTGDPGDDGPLTGIVAIAAGGGHNLALKNDGTVWAWGHNVDGQLGNQEATQYCCWVTAAVPVDGLTGVVDLAADGYGDDYGNYTGFSLALKGDGTVRAWGNNEDGQLGDGTTTGRKAPVQVSGLTGVTQIANGAYHSLALKGDGTAWAWGDNYNGQLGDGTTTERRTPVKVGGLTAATYLEAGYEYSLSISNMEPDTVKPVVKGTTPLAGATGVSPGANVAATFSEKMDEATVTKSTFKLFKVTSSGTRQVTNVTVSLSSDGLKATLNPFGASTTQLAKNAKYKATVTAGARDLAGNALDQNPSLSGDQAKSWTFTVLR